MRDDFDWRRKNKGERPHRGSLCSWWFMGSYFSSSAGGSAAASGAASAGSAAGSAAGAASAGSAAGSAAGAAGASAGSAGAAGAAGAGAAGTGSLTVGQVLNGAAAAFGVLAQIRSAEMNSAMLKSQARDAELRGKAEYVQGLQEANDARERLLRTISQNRAAAGASGISLESEGVTKGQEVAMAEGNRQIDMAKEGGSMAQAARRAQSLGLVAAARSEKMAGYLKGGYGLLNAYDRKVSRG